MEFRRVKGTRDFYPDQMRLRNYICDAWRKVSLRSGFEEYDAPIFEYLDLFTIKSGEEIAEQLFSLTDRGGRDLAIRPEITPSLARMVNAKINSLPRPIRWFSIPRCCRAERPQRGRLREFFQWNVDVIGSDEVLADAECIFVCVDFLREMGLTPQDVQVRIGSRAVASAKLRVGGVAEEQMEKVLLLLDKRPKVTDDGFEKLCAAAGMSGELIALMNEFEEEATRASQDGGSGLSRSLGGAKDLDKPFGDLEALFGYLDKFGVGDYCTYDPRIVRGLAYYTGIVYEVFDRAESLRAVAAGGRYDNLLEVMGGPRVGATGFGMGDVVLGILLEEKGKLPPLVSPLDYFVVEGEGASRDQVLELVGRLRSGGRAVQFSYARRSVGKQLKEANKYRTRTAVIVTGDGVTVRNLTTGDQSEMTTQEFLSQAGR